MLDRLFRRFRRAPLLRSSADLAGILRGAANMATDPAIAREYRESASAIERAAQLTQRHSDAPTADALQYALGRVELNVHEQQSDLLDLLKEQHALLKDQGAAVAGLRADFQETAETLDDWRHATDARLDSFERRMSTSDRDRADIHSELLIAQKERQQLIVQITQLSSQFDQLTAFRDRMEALLAGAIPREQVNAYIAKIERHEQILNERSERSEEAGG